MKWLLRYPRFLYERWKMKKKEYEWVLNKDQVWIQVEKPKGKQDVKDRRDNR